MNCRGDPQIHSTVTLKLAHSGLLPSRWQFGGYPETGFWEITPGRISLERDANAGTSPRAPGATPGAWSSQISRGEHFGSITYKISGFL
jgi:hypothetical protein